MSNPTLSSKKKLAIMRTVSMWVSYDPAKREVVSQHKHKYQVPIVPGRHVIQMKGYYVPVRK